LYNYYCLIIILLLVYFIALFHYNLEPYGSPAKGSDITDWCGCAMP